jgi:hypothetical protein
VRVRNKDCLLTLEIRCESGKPGNVLPDTRIERQRPLDVDVPLTVAYQEYLARLALPSQYWDVIGDIFCGGLCVFKGSSGRCEPCYVVAFSESQIGALTISGTLLKNSV